MTTVKWNLTAMPSMLTSEAGKDSETVLVG
jgi:hypothetical protein